MSEAAAVLAVVVIAGALVATGSFVRYGNEAGDWFGRGFLGYRPETGPPHGVQEQYDVTWRFDERPQRSLPFAIEILG
jgi:hypothetical protein